MKMFSPHFSTPRLDSNKQNLKYFLYLLNITLYKKILEIINARYDCFKDS